GPAPHRGPVLKGAVTVGPAPTPDEPAPARPAPGAGFVWVVHQPAARRYVEREIARDHPGLRLAFSRPGLTTFKVTGDAPAARPSAFARAAGTSLGRADDAAAVLALAEALGP